MGHVSRFGALEVQITRVLAELDRAHVAVSCGTGYDPEKYSSTYSEAAALIRSLNAAASEKPAQEAGFARLKLVQERLIAAGVKDVKFTPAGGWTLPRTEPLDADRLANDLAALLEAYLDGRFRVVKTFGDAPASSALPPLTAIDPRRPESIPSEGERAICDKLATVLACSHDWQPDGGALRFEQHPHGEAPHVHTTCSKCGARAWFLEFQWELLAKGCALSATSAINAVKEERGVLALKLAGAQCYIEELHRELHTLLEPFALIALESRDSWRKQDGSMIELGVPDDAEAFLPSISQGQINKLEAMYERLDKKLARAEGRDA